MDTNSIIDILKRENERLEKENYEFKKIYASLQEYHQQLLRLIKVFRNDYAIIQTKCIQNLENNQLSVVDQENNEQNIMISGFNDFLKGKLHTITEVLNDLQIVLSLKMDTDDENNELHVEEFEDGVEETKD
jgi:hypothetical protein